MTWKDGDCFIAFGALHRVDRPCLRGVSISDIGRTLSRICRYGGHLREGVDFYSVAQHSVLVSRVVPAPLAACGLLHDAAEAILGDLIRPVKIRLPAFVDLERSWEAAIAERWALPFPWPSDVKRADLAVLATELRDLLDPVPGTEFDVGPLPARIEPLFPADAYRLFMQRWEEIVYA